MSFAAQLIGLTLATTGIASTQPYTADSPLCPNIAPVEAIDTRNAEYPKLDRLPYYLPDEGLLQDVAPAAPGDEEPEDNHLPTEPAKETHFH